MTYIKINDTKYRAEISGRMADSAWDGRASKSITLSMTHDEAAALFTEGAEWIIAEESEETDSEGKAVTVTEEYDNSDYSVAGDITDHRDGTVTVKMGKPTELETALEMLLGGEDNV